MGGVFRSDADWIGLVEAAYRSAPDDRTWGEAVVDAARKIVVGGPTTLLSVVFDDGLASTPVLLGGDDYGGNGVRNFAAMKRTSEHAIGAFFFPNRIVNTNRELSRGLTAQGKYELTRFRKAAGIEDAFGAVVAPAPNESAVLFSASAQVLHLSRLERQAFTRLALHIEAGLRLRRHPEVVTAILHPDGRIVHLQGRAAIQERLRERARRVERARTRRHRRTAEALELWSALIEGRQSLVERFDGGQRFYHVIDNAPERRAMLSFTPGEVDAVSDAARGLTAKLSAYGLGISESRVSMRLASACSKLGVASRTELVRIAAIVCYPTRPTLPDAALTATEKEILALLVAGLSNAEIARQRSRAVTTIANQVAALLAKTGSPSRRVLAARA